MTTTSALPPISLSTTFSRALAAAQIHRSTGLDGALCMIVADAVDACAAAPLRAFGFSRSQCQDALAALWSDGASPNRLTGLVSQVVCSCAVAPLLAAGVDQDTVDGILSRLWTDTPADHQVGCDQPPLTSPVPALTLVPDPRPER